MDKIPFIALWDAYRGLLTETQREITDLYFNLDLTASEIAEQKGVTRQGVSECLKTCKKQLEEYESKLHFCELLKNISLQTSLMITDACKFVQAFKIRHPEFSDDMDKLSAIFDSDYSEKVERALSGKGN